MVMCVPISEIFKQHHGRHHSKLGEEAYDVDIPSTLEVEFVGNSKILKFLWLTFNIIILPIRSLIRLEVRTDRFLVLNWIVCLGFGASMFFYSKPTFLFLILSMLNSQGFHPANARQLQRHIHNGEERMLSKKNVEPHTYSYYGPVNKFTLNVGYHLEHHDFHRIPYSKLPELKRIAGEKWYPSTKAHYTRGVYDFYNFVFNPEITLNCFGH
jgi:sphingolipid delta-4 desaturase